MQALLARLRAPNEQSVVGDPYENQGQEELKTNKSVFNNYVKENHRNDLIDVDNVDVLSDTSTLRGDDASDEIDIVMANNRSQSRSRGRSIASTPREVYKNSRNRGSRVSLNSVATSEREDVSVIDVAESDDENITPRRARILTPMQAWAAFEETVKYIDNSNPCTFMKKPKPNFVSSNTFQKVMVDMYGNTEYGNTKGYTLLKQKLNNMARASTLASRMFTSATQKGMEENNIEEVVDDEPLIVEDEPEPEGPQSVSKVFAKRGWKMLKRQVNENVMEQKTQSGKLNWTMLQHTLKQMTNKERTRQDLYERYGIVPTVQDDGTVICENRMLSDRARAQLYGRNKDGTKMDNKRPHSYQPPPTHLRSQSQASVQKKGQVSKKRSNKNGLPNISKTRQRPVTAVR